MQRRELLLSGLTGVAGLPWPAAPAPAASDPPLPDLANLYPVLSGISAGQARRLSFLDPQWKSLAEWKPAARQRFVELLHYNPDPLPLKARVEGVEERDGFRIERVSIPAAGTYELPAWVLVPSGAKGRLPGVVAIHCHSGRYTWGHEKIVGSPRDSAYLLKFREEAYGRPYAESLARRGFVVLVIDGFYFGSRRLRVEDMSPQSAPPVFRDRLKALQSIPWETPAWFAAVNGLCSEMENLVAKTIFSAGATWPGIHVWDDRRSVDYLCSRPDVDAARIGCMGLSIGGLRAAHLIAADPRLKAACVTGWMTVFGEQLRNHLRNHTWMAYIPGLYGFLDLPDAAALIAPGALLVQQCARDSLYPMSGMQAAVEKLTAIYAKARIPQHFRSTFYDVPHSLRPGMQDEAFAWLEKWLL